MLSNEDIKLYGSDYGGFLVAPALLLNGGTALCAGVGEDISFDIQLMGLHNMKIVGVDPTLKSLAYIERIVNNEQYHLLESALIGRSDLSQIEIYENSNPEYVSESILSEHSSVDYKRSRMVSTITIEQIISQHGELALIKMDIEGAEYEVIENLKESPANHFCIEFHHHCTGYSIQDTQNALQKLGSLGYNSIAKRNEYEMTLFKVGDEK